MKFERVTTNEQLQAVLALRTEVFVGEQGVPVELELDHYDQLRDDCVHAIIWDNDEEEAVATGRIVLQENKAMLQRICVRREMRGTGMGELIMTLLEALARKEGVIEAHLHAQLQAELFYIKRGYTRENDNIFMDAGIEHVAMMKKL